MWISGHIEKDELPDEAAVREFLEETGVEVRLVGERRADVPAGVQLENIRPRHQRIDLIYFATPTGPTEIHPNYNEDKVGWYGPEDRDTMAVSAEVKGWCERALSALGG